MNGIANYSETTFEEIKHINEFNQEVWYAHELSRILEYKDYRNFENAIYKAMEACKNSGNEISDHFGDITEEIPSGKGALLPVKGYQLTRYACYLIVQNSDPRKEVIALGQTYFAIKTRQQELIENYDNLSEEQKRLTIRNEIAEHNKSLAEAAQLSGIETPQEYAIFQNKGYQGLYGGLGVKEIHTKKGLKQSQKILDHMGSTELAANLFRATQTDEKLRRDNVRRKEAANQTHYQVGRKVRKAIADIGGIMPEDLPTPGKSIKQLEAEKKKQIKGK